MPINSYYNKKYLDTVDKYKICVIIINVNRILETNIHFVSGIYFSKNKTGEKLLEKALQDKRYKANPDFLLREIGGEAVLVPLGDVGVFENTMLSLNETCAFLWKVFQSPKTAQEAIDEAKAAYDGDASEIEQGVLSFIKDYSHYKLLMEE